ncbi:MAG TPA: hypothetical protein VGB10_06620, partial [Bacteroidota bacterium]
MVTLVIIGVIGLLVFALQGCMEEPNPVGSGVIPPSDLLQLDTATVSSIGSFSMKTVPNTVAPLNILVGKTNEYEAWALIRFSSIPDTLLFVDLVGAEIDLRSVSHFGDSLAPLSFDVHRVLTSWGGDSLNIDTLTAPGFYDPSISSTFQMSTVGDTATISVPLDTTLARAWLNSPLDTANTNFGVLLKPTNTSLVKGFATAFSPTVAHRPQLVARYRRPGSASIDTVRLSTSIATFAATSSVTIPTGDSTRIYLQNGISSHGIVDFTISSLPPRATIHKAVMEITLDPLASRLNSHTRDSVYAFFVDTTGTLTSLFAISEPAVANGQKVYRISITSFVQIWSRSDRPNRIALAGYAESYSLDSFVFYGAQSA